MKNDHILVFLALGLFSYVFRQVIEWLILQLHEMIRVLHAVLCPIVFVLFYDRHWQGRALKRMKMDHFFTIFSRFGLFH